jgi:hypothetical protein
MIDKYIDWDQDIEQNYCDTNIKEFDDEFDDFHQFLNFEHSFLKDDNEYR